MPFLLPNQQRQSTEAWRQLMSIWHKIKNYCFCHFIYGTILVKKVATNCDEIRWTVLWCPLQCVYLPVAEWYCKNLMKKYENWLALIWWNQYLSYPMIQKKLPPTDGGHFIKYSSILNILSLVFGRPFVKRFALCYRTVVLSCLSLTLV